MAKRSGSTTLYVALIGDLVASRQLQPRDRRGTQHGLVALMRELDGIAGDDLASRFAIASGDEFQGLLRSGDALPDLLWRVRTGVGSTAIRIGIGSGGIHTDLQPEALGMDGPAFHRAREAILRSKNESRGAPMFAGFGEDLDRVLCGIAIGQHRLRSAWTERQDDVCQRLRDGRSQAEIASKLRISPQAVNAHVLAAGWSVHQALDAALRSALRLSRRTQRASR